MGCKLACVCKPDWCLQADAGIAFQLRLPACSKEPDQAGKSFDFDAPWRTHLPKAVCWCALLLFWLVHSWGQSDACPLMPPIWHCIQTAHCASSTGSVPQPTSGMAAVCRASPLRKTTSAMPTADHSMHEGRPCMHLFEMSTAGPAKAGMNPAQVCNALPRPRLTCPKLQTTGPRRHDTGSLPGSRCKPACLQGGIRGCPDHLGSHATFGAANSARVWAVRPRHLPQAAGLPGVVQVRPAAGLPCPAHVLAQARSNATEPMRKHGFASIAPAAP